MKGPAGLKHGRGSSSGGYSYGLCGVRLESRQALATLAPARGESVAIRFEIGPKTVDHVVRRERYSIPFVDSPRPFITVAELDDGYRIRAHGLADFVVEPSTRRILCHPAGPDVDSLTIEQLLIDQVLPRMLHILGRPCLHASAVDWDRGAVAFVGASGAGKSTISAAACEAGARLVCDDCLAVSESNDKTILAHPGYGSVRLWGDSARALRQDADRLQLATPRVGKRRAPYEMGSATPHLRAVVRLRRHDGETQISRLRGAEAVRALGAHVHRMVDDDRDALAREFELLGEIAELVPIYELAIQQGHQHIPASLEVLRRELDADGVSPLRDR